MEELQDLIVNVSEKWQNLPKAKYKIGDIVTLEVVDIGQDTFYPSVQSVIEANEMGGLELDIKGTEIKQVTIEAAKGDIDRDGEAKWYYFATIGSEDLPISLKRFKDTDILYKM